MTRFTLRLPSILVAIVTAMGFFIPLHQAQAGLIGTNVNAELLSPLDGTNAGNAADTVTVATPQIEIETGDGTNIGNNWMYPGTDASGAFAPEYIDFFDTGVTLRIAGAAADFSGMTGYSAGAKYVFSGLDPSILGIDSISLSPNISNFSNVAQAPGCTAGICFSAHSLTVFLDEITIGSDGNFIPPMGLVTINLSTQGITPPPPPNPAPEPMTLLLFGIGLTGLGLVRQRRIQWLQARA